VVVALDVSHNNYQKTLTQMFKKIVFIILVGFFVTACSDQVEKKGKKGDFLFRKCAKCGLNEY
jgi:hypothetical protein